MRIKYFFFLFFLFISTIPSHGQLRCHIEHYGIEDGLPQHTIMSILQDHKGLMWFATWNGICKFDGAKFYSYRIQSGDSPHMRSNRIDFIAEDKYGYIWMLPYDGEPCRFDPRTEKFISLRDIDGYENISILTSRIKTMDSGKVWLIKENKGAICVKDSTFQLKIYNSDDHIHDIHEDKDGTTWILTDNGLYAESATSDLVNSYFANRTNNNLSGFYTIMELSNNIWFGSNNGEIQIYDKEQKHFELVKIQTHSTIKSIQRIDDEQVLIASDNDGFFIHNVQTSEADHFHKENLKEMKSNNIKSCHVDRIGNIWFELDHSGVFKFDITNRKMKHFEIEKESKSPSVFLPSFFVLEDLSNRVWVHPQGGGFSYYDPAEDKLVPFYNKPNSPSWRFSNMLHTAFADKQGNLWLSTRTHGLEKVVFPNDIFKSTIVDSNILSPENNEIRCIFEDLNHNLWVSSKANKLYVYDSAGNPLGYLCENGTIAYGKAIESSAYAITQDKDLNIWIATKGEGIYKLTRQKEKHRYTIVNYRNNPKDAYSLSSNNVYSIFQDVRDQIWIGTFDGGLNLLDEQSDGKTRFIHSGNEMLQYPIRTGAKIRIISADRFGNVCVGTTLGLIVFSSDFASPSSIKFRSYIRMPHLKESISANDIYDIHTTAQGETFLATFGGGLNKIKSIDKDGFPTEFQSYGTGEGLPSEVVMTITEDTEGKLWIATEGNLTKFDPEKDSFETFSEIRRLVQGISFSEGARFSSKSGTIYVGHTKGFLSVKTNKIARNDFKPYVSLTNLLIFNQTVPINPTSVLNQNIDNTKELKLNHKQNFFSIEFAALDYTDSQNISYAYKLDGFDEDWITMPKQHIANYTNIQPGEYLFRVKSTNSNGVWMDNEHTLSVIVSPPFWKTGWAYVLYFILLIALFYITLRMLFVYFRWKDKMLLEHEQTEMKTRFFMDVSHEIRTPLTMIIAPIENVMDEGNVSGEVKSQLQLVLKNANRMLRMVNQILDFRKIQKQKISIQEIPIATLVLDVCNNFAKTAESKSINLDFVNNVGDTTLWVDSDGIEKLVFNLLSNAFKHSPSGKTVEVVLSQTRREIKLSVKDEGQGMNKEILNKLFTRFSSFTLDKSKPSTGIGLSIVKEVVEKHHAKIVVESEVDQGSCFSVFFPLGTEHFKDDDITFTYSGTPQSDSEDIEIKDRLTPSDDNEDEGADEMDSNKTILVVEDDDDLRDFIRSVLSPHYFVLEASNGLEGYNIAITDQPDFIISDIMMDRLDGIGLLKKVKENSETSHIPFIFLTAKTNLESKLEGLEYGADDYITKPFSVKYLRAKVENIINQRKHLYESFTNQNYEPEDREEKDEAPSSHITHQDKDFILRMKQEIEKNIDNSEYVVNDLAIAMAMSRTVFYKKVKSLTGFSPIEFIRDIKIKHAAQLLETQNYSIKEVSYMIGISDTKYFTQCFKKQYGMTPSEYKGMRE